MEETNEHDYQTCSRHHAGRPDGHGVAQAEDKPSIVTVVKVTGENWFISHGRGCRCLCKDNPNVDASQIGPAKADAAQQSRIIEDLVAKKVSAIAVVPMDPTALEGVLPPCRPAWHQGHHP